MKGYCKHTKKLESTEGITIIEWYHPPSDHDYGATCKEAEEARKSKYTRTFNWRIDRDAENITEEGSVFPHNDIIPNRWD